MWIRLGSNEIVNLAHVAAIRKGDRHTIDIQFQDFDHARILPFPSKEERDAAFERLVENLVKLGTAME